MSSAASIKSMPPRRRRLGDLLLELGIITKAQLDRALEDQRAYGGAIGERLVRIGALSEDLLIRTLSEQLGLPVADTTAAVDSRALALIPSSLAVKFEVVPLALKRGPVLVIATSDPVNLPMLDELRFRTACRIEACVAAPTAIHSAIERLYGVRVMPPEIELEVISTREDYSAHSESPRWQRGPDLDGREPANRAQPQSETTLPPAEIVRWLGPDDLTLIAPGAPTAAARPAEQAPAPRIDPAQAVTEPPRIRPREVPIPAALQRAGPALPIVPLSEPEPAPRDPPSTPRALSALITLMIRKGFISEEEYKAEIPPRRR
jgi:hypothetical protein